jgi:hypothetical protein
LLFTVAYHVLPVGTVEHGTSAGTGDIPESENPSWQSSSSTYVFVEVHGWTVSELPELIRYSTLLGAVAQPGAMD